MKITAVICELDPFHYGHEYLFRRVKEESDAVIAIMSGGFTERGEAAMLSKYARADAALYGGADLVLELPFPFSMSGAEKFALGGIDIARALGCVDEIAFGSETGDAGEINRAAARLCSTDFTRALAVKKGEAHSEPFGALYFDTYRALYGDGGIFNGSNDILAVSYAKRLYETGSKIKIRAVRREGRSYSGEGEGFSSASEIRRVILSGGDYAPLVPAYSAREITSALAGGSISETERLYAPLAAIYRVCDTSGFSSAYETGDELYNRIKSAFADGCSFSEVVGKAAAKSYSPSKVRRAMIFAALGVTGWDVAKVTYTTVLGANKTGCEILKSIKKTARIDVVTKPADYSSHAYGLAQKAEALVALARRSPAPAGEMMKMSPVIME
ncbi:MAG: nucleotidyltransferase family protein [Clostridia bacterium]|nr:nucleotidyltransferase family protein [Clostridia bacterium]